MTRLLRASGLAHALLLFASTWTLGQAPAGEQSTVPARIIPVGTPAVPVPGSGSVTMRREQPASPQKNLRVWRRILTGRPSQGRAARRSTTPVPA